MDNAKRLLTLIYLGDRLDGLCEALGGFRNDAWHELLLGGTGEVDIDSIHWDRAPDDPGYKEALGAISVGRIAHFDHDWENFLLAQVWDRRVPVGERCWEYALFFNTGANSWVPEVIYWWGARHPSFAEVGSVLDQWGSPG